MHQGTMPRRIVFHIGLAKTGTTSFQRYCYAHRRTLRGSGLLYPRSQLGWARNHSPLVASYIAHRPEDRSVAFRWAPRREAVRALIGEIEAAACATALVSSEHFSTHFDRSEALELADDFAALDPLVILTLRDTHARFLSSYATHVTAGGRLTPDQYAATVLVPGTRFMSLRETVLIWQEAFGRDRLQLVDFDAEPDIVPAVLRRCGIAAGPPPSARRSRVSLPPSAIEELRQANRAIVARQAVGPRDSLGAWTQLTLLSTLCRRHLVRRGSDVTEDRWRLAPETMATLDALAAADLAWLATERGLVLAGSDARDRIMVTAEPRLESGDGSALVRAASHGLWSPSRHVVALCDRLAAAKR